MIKIDIDWTDLVKATVPISTVEEELRQEFVRRSVQDMDRLAWRMIARGQYFHQGWTIGWSTERNLISPMQSTWLTFNCWPVPPKPHA